MDLNVEKEVVALKQMTIPELREKYREVFGSAPKCFGIGRS